MTTTIQLATTKTICVKSETVSKVDLIRTENDPVAKTITALLRINSSIMRLILWSGDSYDSKNGACTNDEVKDQIISLI